MERIARKAKGLYPASLECLILGWSAALMKLGASLLQLLPEPLLERIAVAQGMPDHLHLDRLKLDGTGHDDHRKKLLIALQQ